MPDWYTTFKPEFASPGPATDAMAALKAFAECYHIPKGASWKVFVRGIGLVVTAEWSHDDEGAIPALELSHIGGIPILVDDHDPNRALNEEAEREQRQEEGEEA